MIDILKVMEVGRGSRARDILAISPTKVRCLHAWQAISGVRCGYTEGAAKVTWPPTFNEQLSRKACALAVEATSFTISKRAECEVRGRSQDGRRLPQVGDQRRHILQMKAKYGGLEVSDAKRLRCLEEKNGKLKKLLAEAMLDNAMLKEKALRDCRHLLHDRDTNYSATFRAIIEAGHVKTLPLPTPSPNFSCCAPDVVDLHQRETARLALRFPWSSAPPHQRAPSNY
jgi:hypothetical protein